MAQEHNDRDENKTSTSAQNLAPTFVWLSLFLFLSLSFSRFFFSQSFSLFSTPSLILCFSPSLCGWKQRIIYASLSLVFPPPVRGVSVRRRASEKQDPLFFFISPFVLPFTPLPSDVSFSYLQLFSDAVVQFSGSCPVQSSTGRGTLSIIDCPEAWP